ncbi:Hypothetical predicted protein [Octopus vulgaris]|uniref:Uncharacterized protein n=2 Tax=Octopus TaxID=6643 RepID=A0AA36BSZ8_OCTVU|nr:RNA transcription, translation and transport factor protein-like [Octopus sinensis]CAI9739332.1 Hypothetical predicted protein [Octopus vulgaris]
MSFRRKLLALEYHNPEAFNIKDDKCIRAIVHWLEDQKIRHYKISDRDAIRDTASDTWQEAFKNYLSELGCPYNADETPAVMDWLLGYAVRLEYGDNLEKYKVATADSVKRLKADGKTQSSNPLDNLDFNDPHFKAGIASLSMILQIPPHPDHLEQLKAICILVQEKFSKEALAKSNFSGNPKDHIPIDKTVLGFDAGDYILNDAAKVLRLLHIKELRELQTNINSIIVGVQALTANPKTDTRLGKVGRA